MPKEAHDDKSWMGICGGTLAVLLGICLLVCKSSPRTVLLLNPRKHQCPRTLMFVSACWALVRIGQLGPEYVYAFRRDAFEDTMRGAFAPAAVRNDTSPLDTMPVRVVAFDPARRKFMHRFLREFGFTNVADAALVNASALVPEELVARGQITENFRQSAKNLPYIANSMQHIDALIGAANATQGLLLVEDDLMLNPKLDLRMARAQLHAAVSALPADADALYLEACFEACDLLNFLSPITAARAPACSAAVYFTPTGRQRIAKMCNPVFERIDLMYETLVTAGRLRAYISTPILFFQDAAFGSIMDRGREDDACVHLCVRLWVHA